MSLVNVLRVVRASLHEHGGVVCRVGLGATKTFFRPTISPRLSGPLQSYCNDAKGALFYE